MTSGLNKIGARALCPVCNVPFRNLSLHMKNQHPKVELGYTPAEIPEAQNTAIGGDEAVKK